MPSYTYTTYTQPLSGSTRLSRYQKKHSSTHTPPAHQPSLSASSIYHEPSLLNPRTWQSLCTTSNHVLYGLPLGLESTTSYSIHFFTQSLMSNMADDPPVLCDALCYLVNKFSNVRNKLLKPAVRDFYSAEVLADAKVRLLSDINNMNLTQKVPHIPQRRNTACLLYTSDAADE